MKFLELIKNNMGITIIIAALVVVVGSGYAYMIYDKHQTELSNQQVQAEITQQLEVKEQSQKEENQAEQLAKLQKELEENAEENKKVEIPPLPEEEPAEEIKEKIKQEQTTPQNEEKEIVKPQPEFEKPQLPDNSDTENPDTPPSYDKQETPDTPQKTTPTPQPQQSEPADGTTREDGAIYIKGFGWVEDSGEENKCDIVEFNEGDWDNIIGM